MQQSYRPYTLPMSDQRNGSGQPSNVKASAAANSYSIDLDKFTTRLKSLYSHWNDNKDDM